MWIAHRRPHGRKGNLQDDDVSTGLERLGGRTPPVLNTVEDLNELAESDHRKDPSHANGSSIALVLEYAGVRVLFAGDAFADDLVEGLKAFDSTDPLPIDVFKLPHHGSAKNVSDELVKAVSCPTWLFSTDGTQLRHPDAIAVARGLVLTFDTD